MYRVQEIEEEFDFETLMLEIGRRTVISKKYHIIYVENTLRSHACLLAKQNNLNNKQIGNHLHRENNAAFLPYTC